MFTPLLLLLSERERERESERDRERQQIDRQQTERQINTDKSLFACVYNNREIKIYKFCFNICCNSCVKNCNHAPEVVYTYTCMKLYAIATASKVINTRLQRQRQQSRAEHNNI